MFSVTPRIGLSDTCTRIAQEHGRKHRFRQLYRGYAALAELYTA